MRQCIQRVSEAAVTVDGQEVARIGQGLLVLVSFGHEDTAEKLPRVAEKLVKMRIFEDESGKMNRSVTDVQGSILLVSQFTLHASTRHGHRPSFDGAMAPAEAQRLFTSLVSQVALAGVPVAQGIFGARMAVSLINDGPVTIWMEDEG